VVNKRNFFFYIGKNWGFFFFFQFLSSRWSCEIMHKRNEPNLAIGQTGQQKLFGILPSSGNLQENSFLFWKKGTFKPFFPLKMCQLFVFFFSTILLYNLLCTMELFFCCHNVKIHTPLSPPAPHPKPKKTPVALVGCLHNYVIEESEILSHVMVTSINIFANKTPQEQLPKWTHFSPLWIQWEESWNFIYSS